MGPGISITPSRISSNSLMDLAHASKTASWSSRPAAYLSAPCVIHNKSTNGNIMRNHPMKKNTEVFFGAEKRLNKVWHTGDMMSSNGLSFNQLRQKIWTVRCVGNTLCAADRFIQINFHLTHKLAGEVPFFTSVPRTEICLQLLTINIARY